MLKFLWVLPFLLCLSKNIISENFQSIDSLSIQTPNEKMRSLDGLVAYCESQTQTDLGRVRFYFVWIATHIQYDENSMNDNQDALSVFNTKKALCSGYTRLLMRLCEQSGISVRYVAGYGKDIFDSTNIQNHAWNIIYIDGDWHAFDVTWAANDLDDNKQVPFSPAFEEWFMPQKAAFQKTHLPFDPAYQLTNQLITREAFFNTQLEMPQNTEGGDLLQFNFKKILNADSTLDSLERTWLSFRRAYHFMPMDSAVAIKLAKTQAAKVKPVFDLVKAFNKNEYRIITQLPVEKRRDWGLKLQNLEVPLQESLKLYAELETFPLSDDNKKSVKNNLVYYQKLVSFAKVVAKELRNEIALRE